jgi:hypothetical protein
MASITTGGTFSSLSTTIKDDPDSPATVVDTVITTPSASTNQWTNHSENMSSHAGGGGSLGAPFIRSDAREWQAIIIIIIVINL